MNNGILYLVATPIGNLEDITYRAVRILKEVDLVVCEDTRHSQILLSRYEITTHYISYHQHSKLTKIDYIISQLKEGKNVAIISDAGTPGICDPGGILVTGAVKNNIQVVPIPGPSALVSLLSASGFSTDSFLFLGYLPKKKGRQTLFRNLMKAGNLELYQSIVLYVSPYQLQRTLADLQLAVGNKEIVVGRELTKKFEEIFRGKLYQAIEHFGKSEPKGEFVVVIKTS
ncbi:MAG: 16S rRNA (cytidine(1402)-2'-O)-methyltransferase [Patescibacteria group bacterium]|nr:16S rRNA (cytidine(1402)-2'-O)-methyltransferase [Patescibacteria group bacterium]